MQFDSSQSTWVVWCYPTHEDWDERVAKLERGKEMPHGLLVGFTWHKLVGLIRFHITIR